ncbi:LOW QUALITY PROTEIN: uncharacterized protein EMH_0002520 [Eimeria mitis]|uniref:Uncharacterized protein n=1 Tax=Eimeria mitis TaxID=44415 RepID=U6JTY7_9EIME|nr:LOW QUALITY PROTEIN: uncharacterized protein EMH_0002520 [Eimeria mitis]CDJ28915.1 hypothetical protein, conserved [Eimeria mitis]
MEPSAGLPVTGTALLAGEAAAGAAAGENLGAEADGGFEEYGEEQEGSEDYEDDESLSFDLPLETPKQGVPILLASSLLGAWILLLVAVGWSALKGGGRTALDSLPLDSDSLLTYREKFRDSVDKLEETWKETPEPVKLAFAKYHMPTTSDEKQMKPAEAWALLQRQMDVTSLCNSAALRLHGLAKLESKVERAKLHAEAFGTGEGVFDMGAVMGDQMTFDEFLRMFPARIQQEMEDYEVPGTVPTSLGMKLAMTVEALDTYAIDGRYVAMRYDSVLEAYGMALETVNFHNFADAPPVISPADKTPANAEVLMRFIAQQFVRSNQRLWAPIVVKACAEDWNEETVKNLLDEVEDGEAKRVRELLQEKRELVQKAVIEKPLHDGHILPLSVFLL